MHHHGLWSISATLVLVLAAILYSRAWRSKARDVRRFWAFFAGLLVLWVASASPLATLDHQELTAHMVQHLLIMTIAAPLLLWGARNAMRLPTGVHPAVCWLAGTGVVVWWHIPGIFELGMSSAAWHGVEQSTFLAAGLLFWLPVMKPQSSGRDQWLVPLYLFLATLPCDALSAFLTFCGHVVYRPYQPGPGSLDTLAQIDQASAGALMWVWVTFAYLFPAVAITLRILSPRGEGSVETAAHLRAV